MDDKPKPDILYKFRTWTHCDQPNKKHQSVLREGILWAPVAKDLNDPFDCCIPFRWDLMKRSHLKERFARRIQKDNQSYPWEQCLALSAHKIDQLGICDPKRKDKVLSDLAFQYRGELAVLSLAGDRTNPLLWSHYADSYKGFCVGIDPSRLVRLLLDQHNVTGLLFHGDWVSYRTDLPEVKPPINDEGDMGAFLKLFTTKSDCWQYESEYRYIFKSKSGFPLKMSPASILQIILGPGMQPQHRDEILAIAAEKYPQAKVLQAKRKALSFELEFISP